MRKKYRTALVLKDYELKLYLGVKDKERSKKQTVLLTVRIDFFQPPAACKTGKLADTVCYDALVKKIKIFCQGKKFTLIESLGAKLFSLVKQSIAKKDKLTLSVTKLYPLAELPQATFEISD